jgi:3-dehydroquinate synthase
MLRRAALLRESLADMRVGKRVMKTLFVDLEKRSYKMHVGNGILRSIGDHLIEHGFTAPPIVVTNSTVLRLHGRTLLRSIKGKADDLHIVRIGDGERFKNQATLWKIYSGLFKARADRSSWILAFGGGVVGDIAGFAAATFMRGIPYVNIPTTLLAQVDSAVGGKVGINVPQGKNLIGAFHQPAAVFSDPGTLRTLPSRELAAGIYEVIKCGAIHSESLIGYVEKHLGRILKCDPLALQHIVLESCRIKADVVARDERENDLRMILNYGHTVGHALEAATSYRRFKHGEAIAWGMLAALGYGRELGFLELEDIHRISALIHRVETLPPLSGISVEDVWVALVRDKKARSGNISMVLLRDLGDSMIRKDIDASLLKRYLQQFLSASGDLG